MLCLLWSYFFTMFVIILGWNNIHVYLTGKQIPIYLLFCFVVGLNKCLVWGHQRRHLNSPTKPPSECLYHYIIDCTVPIHGQYVVYMYDCTYTQVVYKKMYMYDSQTWTCISCTELNSFCPAVYWPIHSQDDLCQSWELQATLIKCLHVFS